MAAVEARRPFDIPSGDELEAIASALDAATSGVERLELDLLHATGRIDGEPLVRFGRRPNYEDIGTLWTFADDVKSIGENIVEWAKRINELLSDVDMARMERTAPGGPDA